MRSRGGPDLTGQDAGGFKTGDGVSGDGEPASEGETYRRDIRDQMAPELRSERDQMRQIGRYCYEGAWLTLEEIRANHRARRRREWVRLLELIALLLGLCGVAYVLYKLLFLLA